MEKFGVVIDDEKVKTAESGTKCPMCGRDLSDQTVPGYCPNCGTKPFEKQPKRSSGDI